MRRRDVISRALRNTAVSGVVEADFIHDSLHNSRNTRGLYGLFQHAVHLITVDRIELRTTS